MVTAESSRYDVMDLQIHCTKNRSKCRSGTWTVNFNFPEIYDTGSAEIYSNIIYFNFLGSFTLCMDGWMS